MKKINFGLKLWSPNVQYIPVIEELVRQGYCDFVEIYVHWQTSHEHLAAWKNVRVPVRLHAPHTHGGFNPSVKEHMEQKQEVLKQVEAYRVALDPRSVVFHPGINGDIMETVAQYQQYQQQFPALFKTVLIENKPKVGIKDEMCCGAAPAEIRTVIAGTGFGFCLDFGHAICYAAWAKLPWKKVVDDFLTLSPSLFHLSDIHTTSVIDEHLHFGQGNVDLKWVLQRLPENVFLAIETKHDFKDNLDDYKWDVDYLRGVE